MRILLISSYFYPHPGGSQQYMEELYRNLMKIDSSVQVDVLCYNTDKAKKTEQYHGFTIYRVPCSQVIPGQFALPNYFRLVWTLVNLSQKHTYDIVHSNTRFFDHSLWVPLVARLLDAKAVLTDHCATHPRHKSKIITIISRLMDRFSAQVTSRFYDLITVANNATARFVQTIGMKRPIIIYGGVDISLYKILPQKVKRTLPVIKKVFTSKDVIVIFLGRMIETKNPQLLFNSTKSLLRKYRNLYFIFAGDGIMVKKLDSINFNREKILFLGSLNRNQVVQLLTQTDIVVHPSRHHEGFPNVLLEAGAAGCAVIATDAGGTNELIIDGKTGLLIKPTEASLKSALILLLNNKNKRNLLGRELRMKVEHEFNWEMIAYGFKKVLYNLLSIKPLAINFNQSKSNSAKKYRFPLIFRH